MNYATQIAAGLQAAHKKGVVHRDIKSANIMIREEGQVKIMDFGLAKIRGGAQFTKVGTTLGTAAYMSPEQARGEEADHRSDIWSFGVVLYEMLTGKLPFPGDYEQAVIYSIMNTEPESITGLRPETPVEFESIVNKAMAKSRDDRYQTMDDMLLTLRAFGEKPAPPLSQTPSKTSSKLLIGGFSAMFLLLVGLGYFYFRPRVPEPRILRTLPLTSAPGLEESPTWSPDSKQIVFHSLRSGNRDIWVKPVAGGAATQLTNHPAMDWNPAWSPDGKKIVFGSFRQGTRDVWVMSTKGGEPRQLTRHEAEDGLAIWSPDGSRLVFFSNRIGQFELFLVSAEGGEPVQLTHGELINSYPCFWAADGSAIYAIAQRGSDSPNFNIWAVPVTDGAARQVTDFKGSSKQLVNFSSDGERFYLVFDERLGDIWVAELAGEE